VCVVFKLASGLRTSDGAPFAHTPRVVSLLLQAL
jgi:hypothetical protein